jgi:hypothetical protein
MVFPKLVRFVQDPVAVIVAFPPEQIEALEVTGGAALVMNEIGPTQTPLFAPQLERTQT